MACDLSDAYVGMTLAPQQSDVPVIRADQPTRIATLFLTFA